jgi:hypothetical protein
MQYSPKLKKAMEEIKAILKKHDIAGCIILHTPGFSEYLNHIETSYSVAWHENGGIRVKSKGRDNKHLTDTVNMIHHFGAISGQQALAFMDLEEMLKSKMDIEHGKGNHSGHDQQNN